MKDVLAVTDKLKAELPQMLAEHKTIVAALQNPVAVAKRANRPEYASLLRT
jgi:hypothetical protein